MLTRLAAAAALVVVLWMLFRFAMGLRAAKLFREEAHRAAAARGRRVVAEIPLGDDLVFLLEDDAGFYWADREARKPDVVGAWLLLNGAVAASFARAGTRLPDLPPAGPAPGQEAGRERWDVVVYLGPGRTEVIPCGTLREGISRDIARGVFEALERGRAGMR